MKKIAILVITLGALAILGSAVVGAWKLTHKQQEADAAAIAADYPLPQFVYSPSAPPRSEEAYRGAIAHPEVLEWIPCYCNCGRNAGHRSVLDCFIASRDGDEITFDGHGAG